MKRNAGAEMFLLQESGGFKANSSGSLPSGHGSETTVNRTGFDTLFPFSFLYRQRHDGKKKENGLSASVSL